MEWPLQSPDLNPIENLWATLKRKVKEQGRVSNKKELWEAIEAGELVSFAPAESDIDFVAETDTHFVLGSAALHPHALVTGMYSVHTSANALTRGEAEIRRLGMNLQAAGQLG